MAFGRRRVQSDVQKRRRREGGVEDEQSNTYQKQAHFEELAAPSRELRFGGRPRLRLRLDLGLSVRLAIVGDIGEAKVGGPRERER